MTSPNLDLDWVEELTEQQILEATIMLVDDSKADLQLLEEVLRTAGYGHVHGLSDPTKAVRDYSELRPDLLVLDLAMPGKDGFEVMSELRQVEQRRHLPVLVLTGADDRETRLRALGAGARDILTKPFDVVEIRMRIRCLLEVCLLHKQLVHSHRESEQLLLNVLPAPVADKLKRTGTYTPVRCEDASVMFTDFQGFTQVAEELSPQRLVEELEVCFTYFDRMTDEHGLQRLKTIGDAYMCVGGLPESNRTHPVDCVLSALRMARFMEARAAEMIAAGSNYWGLRIGINTGPLVAGVIGKERFAFDVWGDTVNTANRMESSGESGRVNVSRATYERVAEYFECEARGKIAAKGKGPMDMWFVDRLRPELSADALGIRPNARFYERIQALDVDGPAIAASRGPSRQRSGETA